MALTNFCHLILYNQLAKKELIGFVFFSTLFAYNFHRRVGRSNLSASEKTIKEEWLEQHKRLISFLIFISFCMAAYFCYQLSKEVLILIFPLGLLSVFYVLEISKMPSLRSLPFLKIFIISFVWGGVAVLLPLLSNHSIEPTLEWQSHLFALLISLFVFAETIPFDIRDIKQDQYDGLKTLPNKIGIGKSKMLSLVLYAVSVFLMLLLSSINGWDSIYTISYGFAVVYSLILINFLKPNSKELYYSLGIESTLCMPLVSYYFLSLF